VTELLPGVRPEDLAAAEDPDEGMRVALAATQKLKLAYGDRLSDVVLFGSWVRGEAHEESDVDLLVVLDQLDDRAAERNRIVEILFDLEADSRRAIQAFPVPRTAVVADGSTFVSSALREGVGVLRGGS
jgi:predicted nucleotidyltransferase